MDLKVGFIGCGGIAEVHIQVLSKIKEVQLASFCDMIEERARLFNSKYAGNKGKVYSNFEEMFEKEELDIVYICLPPFAHSDEVEIAAEKGIHIFIEKPIALNMEKANSMVAAVKKHNVKTQVGFQLRFGTAVEFFKNMVDNGEAGQAGLFLAKYYCNSLHSPWWRDKSKSGGQVVEQIIHLYDLSRFLIGEPRSVYCLMDNLFHKDIEGYTSEDVSIALIKFKNKCLGSVSATNFAIPGRWLHELDIITSNLTIRFTDANNAVFTKTDRIGNECITISSDKNLYEAVTLDFINAVKNDALSRVPIDEGAKSLRFVLSVRRSAEEGREIPIET
ncbi:MAG: Gfo/Idh/MocA family oxidoreductase [Thermoproteota archaeon]